MRSLTVVALALVLVGVPGRSFAAGVFFFDDFESPTTPVTYWVNTSDDADPTTPVIGPSWQTLENIALYQMQEVDHPTDLVGPPWDGLAGPTWDASATGGNQYLHMWGYSVLNGYAAAPIPGTNQTEIAASGYLKLDVETYALSGVDGWDGGLRITGWDAAVGTLSGKAFDVLLMPNGDVVNNPGGDTAGTIGAPPTYNAGYSVVSGLTHNVNTWEQLSILADFNSDTFALTLDGVTVSGLTWNAAGLSSIQYVTLALPHKSNPRGGYDNFTLFVPEPASLGLVVAGVGVLLARNRMPR